MVWEQNFAWLFYHFNFEKNYFNFEKNYNVLNSKTPCILLNKNINFNKNETESKMKNPTHNFKTRTLCFSSYKNHKLKVKLWWVGARTRKKRAFFVPFTLCEGIFFNICVLSQCVVYWIHWCSEIWSFVKDQLFNCSFFRTNSDSLVFDNIYVYLYIHMIILSHGN